MPIYKYLISPYIRDKDTEIGRNGLTYAEPLGLPDGDQDGKLGHFAFFHAVLLPDLPASLQALPQRHTTERQVTPTPEVRVL